MFIVRIVAFFLLILVSIVGLLAAFENPKLVLIPLICVPLALYIVGYISRFASAEAKLSNFNEEVELRSSSGYGARKRFVGVVALFLGGAGFALFISKGELVVHWQAALAAIVIFIAGAMTLFFRRKAEVLRPAPEILAALIARDLQSGNAKEAMLKMQQLATEDGLSQVKIDVASAKGEAQAQEGATRMVKEVADKMLLSETDRQELENMLKKQSKMK
jgi:hypothetical protein